MKTTSVKIQFSFLSIASFEIVNVFVFVLLKRPIHLEQPHRRCCSGLTEITVNSVTPVVSSFGGAMSSVVDVEESGTSVLIINPSGSIGSAVKAL